MIFQKEYEILNNLTTDKILEISFTFNESKLKVYFTNSSELQFLVLVCETKDYTFVRNFPMIPKHNGVHIDGRWNEYLNLARCLTTDNGWFGDFYNKLKKSIHSVNEHHEEFKIAYLNKEDGVSRIREATNVSPIKGKPVYFNHIRRTPMSNKQFEKTSMLLGEETAMYLRKSKITTVFTSDITKQKSFILA